MATAIKTIEEAIRDSIKKRVFLNNLWSYLSFILISIALCVAGAGMVMGILLLARISTTGTIITGIVSGLILFALFCLLIAWFCALLFENASQADSKKAKKFKEIVKAVKGRKKTLFWLNLVLIVLYLVVIAGIAAASIGVGGGISVLLEQANIWVPFAGPEAIAKGSGIIGGIIVFAGLMVAMVVGLIIVSPFLVLAYPMSYVEDNGFWATLSKAWKQGKKNYLRLLGKNLLFMIILLGAYTLCSAVREGARIPLQGLGLLSVIVSSFPLKILVWLAIGVIALGSIALHIILMSWIMGLEASYAYKIYAEYKK